MKAVLTGNHSCRADSDSIDGISPDHGNRRRWHRQTFGFSIFRSTQQIIPTLLFQFQQRFLSKGILTFTARRKRKEDFGDWPQIAATLRGFGVPSLGISAAERCGSSDGPGGKIWIGGLSRKDGHQFSA